MEKIEMWSQKPQRIKDRVPNLGEQNQGPIKNYILTQEYNDLAKFVLLAGFQNFHEPDTVYVFPIMHLF